MCWTLKDRLSLALLSAVILAREHLVEGHGEESVNDAISPLGFAVVMGGGVILPHWPRGH